VSRSLDNTLTGGLEQELARGRLSPAYLVLGPEEYLVRRAVEILKRHVVNPELAAFNLAEFDAASSNMAEIAGAARTLPMMSARRLVIVRNLHLLPEAERLPLLEYLGSPSGRCVLVLTAPELDRRTSFYKSLRSRAQVLEYPKLKGGALEAWAANHMRAGGYTVAPGVVKRLLDAVGTDLQTLANEIEKLMLLAGGARMITEETIGEIAGAGRQRGIFELTDAMGRHDVKAALRILGSMLNSGESPLMIVTMMARHYRQILIVKEMLEGRRNPSEISQAAQLPRFILDDFLRQAKSIDREAAQKMYLKLAETDRRFKSTNVDHRMVLESLICAI
jgi:DNA polymerase-3 subunit delta